MNKIKSSIPKTNIYRQINQYRWDIRIKVSDQMDDGLYCSGREMIADKVYSDTHYYRLINHLKLNIINNL